MSADGIHARTPIALTPSAIARFWSRVEKSKGCWLWTGCDRGNGYGCFKLNGKVISTHCFSYTLHFGEIEPGLIVCHKCDTPRCVRPDHLFAGTPKANVADMNVKGRRNQARGEKAGAARLTEDDIAEVWFLKSLKMSNRRIASLMSVNPATIDAVVNGRSWSHIHPSKQTT